MTGGPGSLSESETFGDMDTGVQAESMIMLRGYCLTALFEAVKL